MEDGKVQPKLIEKESLRNAVYRKKVAELKKNTQELSTSCNVLAMVISFDSSGKSDVWPENREEIHAILNKYQSYKQEGLNKMKMDSESVMMSEIKKKKAELDRLTAENNLLEKQAIGFIDSKLAELKERIALLSNNEQPGEVVKPE